MGPEKNVARNGDNCSVSICTKFPVKYLTLVISAIPQNALATIHHKCSTSRSSVALAGHVMAHWLNRTTEIAIVPCHTPSWTVPVYKLSFYRRTILRLNKFIFRYRIGGKHTKACVGMISCPFDQVYS